MTFWVAGAAVVAGVGGAAISANSAGNAADKQAAGTQAGIDAQTQQYNQTRTDQAPYRNTGYGALDQLANLSGVSVKKFNTDAYLAANPDVAADPYWSQHAEEHFQTYGAKENRQGGSYTQTGPQDAGFGSYAQGPTAAEVQMDPGYQFGLTQGQEAIDRKTAAAGGRISGAALKAAAQYGTDYGTTGYSTAYNRVNQARSDRLNRLAALAGIGQTSVQQTGTAGAGTANQISAMTTAQGNASGAAQIAQGNIWGNAGNQLAALYGRNANTGAYNPTYSAPVNMGTASGSDMSTFYQ